MRMCRDHTLHGAWRRVRRNKGAASVDRVTIGEVEQHGVQRFLIELDEVPRAGEYGVQVVRRVYIRKANGKTRPLGMHKRTGPRTSASLHRACAGRLGLRLHPKKTRTVELHQGTQGFDFLGCHLHERVSGGLWEQKRLNRYCLHRWRSRRAMKRVRERVKGLTPGWRCHQDVQGVIAELNLMLRGWGPYVRSGSAANHSIQVDQYAVRRLKGRRLKRAGRNLRAGQAQRWGCEHFESLGLYHLRGTIRYPLQAFWNKEAASCCEPTDHC